MGGKRREKAEVFSPSKTTRLPEANAARCQTEECPTDTESFDENFAEPPPSDAEILDESTDDETRPPANEAEASTLNARVPFNFNRDAMEDDEELVADPSAYDMLHHFQGEWPCLSFDIIAQQTTKLLSTQEVTIVGGSQAGEAENSLTIYRCKNLKRTWRPDNSSDDSGEESDSDEELDGAGAAAMNLQSSYIRSKAAFNKVAVCPKIQHLVATNSDDSKVSVYDVSQHLRRLENPICFADPGQSPIGVYTEHTDEGFGLDWQQESSGGVGFASANRDGKIVFYEPVTGGWSSLASIPTASAIESVSWKYGDVNILAAGSCDGNVTLYDKRAPQSSALKLEGVHAGDVNVVAFGTHPENCEQLLSGGDDATIRLVDVRFPSEALFVNKDFHSAPICALDWSKSDFTTFVAGSYDDRCTLWDLSAEGGEILEGWPCQLIFEHCGQNQLHSVRCHPTIPYMFISAGIDGFNVWRPEDLFEFAKTLQISSN